jgi:serine protease Do
MFITSRRSPYNTIRLITLATSVCLIAPAANASTDIANPLIASSSAIEALVQRVSRSVVQIVVTGLQPGGGSSGGTAVGRGRSIGSGFVVDRGGFIMTNAHVIRGAEQIGVIIAKEASDSMGAGPAGARVVRASIAGVVEEWDLALLKIDVDLEPLPLADYNSVRQGQLVFAFGSPDGLRNSVTMGMVSAVARQMQANSPLVYIQTDAAINPGNSGGPLVNARGEVVGIDTFIRSSAGGSDGLGFALPSSAISLAYPQLRDYGHLRRVVIGIMTQTVTPLIAQGLHLPSADGLIVEHVAAGRPAAAAGVRVGDVITAIDRRAVDDDDPARLFLQLASVPALRQSVSGVGPGRALVLQIARGGRLSYLAFLPN